MDNTDSTGPAKYASSALAGDDFGGVRAGAAEFGAELGFKMAAEIGRGLVANGGVEEVTVVFSGEAVAFCVEDENCVDFGEEGRKSGSLKEKVLFGVVVSCVVFKL